MCMFFIIKIFIFNVDILDNKKIQRSPGNLGTHKKKLARYMCIQVARKDAISLPRYDCCLVGFLFSKFSMWGLIVRIAIF